MCQPAGRADNNRPTFRLLDLGLPAGSLPVPSRKSIVSPNLVEYAAEVGGSGEQWPADGPTWARDADQDHSLAAQRLLVPN